MRVCFLLLTLLLICCRQLMLFAADDLIIFDYFRFAYFRRFHALFSPCLFLSLFADFFFYAFCLLFRRHALCRRHDFSLFQMLSMLELFAIRAAMMPCHFRYDFRRVYADIEFRFFFAFHAFLLFEASSDTPPLIDAIFLL